MDNDNRDRRNRPHSLRHQYSSGLETQRRRQHPSSLVAVVLVDGLSPICGEDRHLTCFGAFEVAMVDDEPVFVSHHRSTTIDDDRFDLLGELSTLSHASHVVLGSANAYETFWDCRHILRDGLAYIEMMATLEIGEPSDLSQVGTPEQVLIDLASSFGLPQCFETDFLSQAFRAGVRAQLIWLAYVAKNSGRREARNLFAAFRAWQVIERARPVPF